MSCIDEASGRRAATGETEARAQRNRQTLAPLDHHAAITAGVALRPDATPDEPRARLLATRRVEAGLDPMHQTLARLGPTREKKSGRVEEQDRPDVAPRRADWRAGKPRRARRGRSSSTRPVPPPTWPATEPALDLIRGRGPRGEPGWPGAPLEEHAPRVEPEGRHFVGGLTTRGFVAPYVLDGAIDDTICLAWTEQMPAQEPRPRDIVIPPLRSRTRPPRGSDEAPAEASWTTSPPTRFRASARRSRRATIEAPGAERRYLPPRQPDLDPSGAGRRLIRSLQGTRPAEPGGEQAFAKPEALPRKAAKRTVDGSWTAIGQLLDLFPPTECANDLVHAGYPRSASKCSGVPTAAR